MPAIEQSETCIVRHKTLVELQESPETFNISYREEAFYLDWVLKVISDLNPYQNQIAEEMEKLTQNLSTVDREIYDELHYIEFCNLDASEGYKSYKRLEELQQERHAIENSFEILDTMQVIVSGVSKIKEMVIDPAKKSYTLRESETSIHDWCEWAFLLSLSVFYEALLFALAGGNIMFDIRKRKDLSGSAVRRPITELLELPMDARVSCCGDNNIYLHVEVDNSAVRLDHPDLDGYYEMEALWSGLTEI